MAGLKCTAIILKLQTFVGSKQIKVPRTRRSRYFFMVTEAGLGRCIVHVLHRFCSPVCGARQKLRLAKQARFLPTAALRSGRSSRPRRRSPRLPNELRSSFSNPCDSCEACYHKQKRTPPRWVVFFFGCGGRTRTYDLRVMSKRAQRVFAFFDINNWLFLCFSVISKTFCNI